MRPAGLCTPLRRRFRRARARSLRLVPGSLRTLPSRAFTAVPLGAFLLFLVFSPLAAFAALPAFPAFPALPAFALCPAPRPFGRRTAWGLWSLSLLRRSTGPRRAPAIAAILFGPLLGAGGGALRQVSLSVGAGARWRRFVGAVRDDAIQERFVLWRRRSRFVTVLFALAMPPFAVLLTSFPALTRLFWLSRSTGLTGHPTFKAAPRGPSREDRDAAER